MQAAIMRQVARPLEIEDVPLPEISLDEVLVETRCCGICGTDLHIMDGFGYVPPLPHILGHEPSGVVAAVGNRVTGFREGDRVVPHLFFSCGECYYCRVGSQQQCIDLRGILGVLCPGAFAEYFKAPAANLFKLPENIPFDQGGLVADAVITSVHAFKRSGLRLGDKAVVIGAGGIGLTLLQLLCAAGVSAIAVDRSDTSLEVARKLGAALTLKAASEHAAAQIKEFTGGIGVHCVIDCVGNTDTLRAGASYVMRGGRIVVIGEGHDTPPTSTIEIAQKELEIIGSRNGTRQDMVEAIHLLESGVVRPQIARRFSLAEINAAFDFVRRGATGRVIVTVRP